MVDENLSSSDIGAILTITPTVHVKAVAERRAQLHVMPSLIAVARHARAGNGVAVEVEQVSLDQ